MVKIYENMTFEFLLDRVLERVSGIQKQEGSILFNSIAPSMAELADFYRQLDWIVSQNYADTASRDFLIRHCKQRGIMPYQATCAISKGEFNVDIPIGSRFSMDLLTFIVTKPIDSNNHFYELMCETAGSNGNYLGPITAISYIKDLETANLTEILIAGEDEEETEHLRKRYFNSLKAQAFGGNIADYKEKINAIAGVGGVKVYPVWAGGGTVKVVIVSALYKCPSSSLIELVKNTVDPDPYGKGYGLAPIGHTVTVFGAESETIDFDFQLIFESGYQFESCKQNIESVIENYLIELNKTWEDRDHIVIRVSQIESRLLNVTGILDVLETKINDSVGNYELEPDAIAIMGAVYGS